MPKEEKYRSLQGSYPVIFLSFADVKETYFQDEPVHGEGGNDRITRDKIAFCEAKDSVFSDLNHLEAVTSNSCKYEASFGFTEMEVFAAMDEFGLTEKEESYLKVEHVGMMDVEKQIMNCG